MGHQVINHTRSIVVATHVSVANHFFARLMGLMGKAALPAGHGLWLEPCHDIHSCFMRFPFDALFVDRHGVVHHQIEHMKPWRVSKWVRNGHAVLELPAGTIAQTGTQPGDHLELQPK